MGKRRQRPRRGKNDAAGDDSIDFGPLAGWVGFNLRLAQEASFQAFSRRSREAGESPGRFATLTIIARNPGISQTELSHANGRDKSSLTPVVEDLVRRGLVERKPHPSDGRQVNIALSQRGAEINSSTKDLKRAWLAQATVSLKEEELRVLSRAGHILKRLLAP